MVKRNPNAHQSNHYKATHHSGSRSNKKSGGKSGKGNKSINQFLGIGKPGPHLLQHRKLQAAKKDRAHSAPKKGDAPPQKNQNNYGTNIRRATTHFHRKIVRPNNKKQKQKQKQRKMDKDASGKDNSGPSEDQIQLPQLELLEPQSAGVSNVVDPDGSVDEYERDLQYQYDDETDNTSTAASPAASSSKSSKKKKKLRKQRVTAPTTPAAPADLAESTASTTPIVKEDDVKLGSDFIAFDFGDDDEEDDDNINAESNMQFNAGFDPNKPVEPTETTASNAGNAQRQPSNNSLHQKRKRSPDYGSDTEGSTGPPPGCPWMGRRQYSKMDSVPQMLTQELKDFVDFISPSREEHQVRQYVCDRVQKIVEDLWPGARAEIFGSFDTMLYLPSSDLDIVIIRDQKFIVSDYRALGNYLRKKGIGQHVTVIAAARVPIVKFKESISKISVDISFNVESGLNTAVLVKTYMDNIPALRPLTMLIKHYLMVKGYNEVFTGGIGSYTTMIMILSFLQMHPKVQSGQILPEENLGVLLIEFFELYGMCFNYSKVGLTVTGGGQYFIKPRSMANQGRGHGEQMLCSIDPNDSTNDTAKGSYMLKKIRETFAHAYGNLIQNVRTQHETLFGGGSSSNSSKTNHIRFDDHNRVPADSRSKSSGLHHRREQVSLIKSILPIPVDVMQHRRHLEEVFYKGQFQDMFGHPHGINGLDQISN